MHFLDGRITAQRKSMMKRKLGFRFPPAPLTPPSALRTPVAAAAAVAVDYPRSGERVVSREYTFRISTQAPGSVEISIDDNGWVPCRQAAGFWWHDWSGYNAGPHTVFARVSLERGRGVLSERREFLVEPA
jgi:hypothetical protein